MKHYEKHEIEFYRSKNGSFRQRLKCSWHLKWCRECREKLRELENDDIFIEDVSKRLSGLEQASDMVKKNDPDGSSHPGGSSVKQ